MTDGDPRNDRSSRIARVVGGLDHVTSGLPDRIGRLFLWLSTPVRDIRVGMHRQRRIAAREAATTITSLVLVSLLALGIVDAALGYRLPLAACSILLGASASVYSYIVTAVATRAPLAEAASPRSPGERLAASPPGAPNRIEVIEDTTTGVGEVIRGAGTLLLLIMLVLPRILPEPGPLWHALTRPLPGIVPTGTALLDLALAVCIALALLTQPFRLLARTGVEVLARTTGIVLLTTIASLAIPRFASLIGLASLVLVMTEALVREVYHLYQAFVEFRCWFMRDHVSH